MAAYLERLAARTAVTRSVLCVGIDPEATALPAGFPATLAGVERFARLVLEASLPVATAVKPNLAFFEAYGAEGIAALERLRALVPADVPFVADAKRGDIGTTAARQAAALYDVLGADAVTVNPYLGEEAIMPLLERGDRFAYVLCRTSNPGAAELQGLEVAADDAAGQPAEPLYARVARRVTGWGPGGTVGLDDYDGDGRKDHTCGTQDFGGGLVLRKPCEVNTPNEPPEGVTLVDGSLFGYNGSTDIPLDNISGSLLLARGEAGDAVVIVTFNTDNLFEVNSSDVASPDTMDGVIVLLNKRWPNSKVQVRGHTDGTGGVNANQTLSERRATSIKTYLEQHGLKASEITTVGLGATQPFAKENSEAARQFNRRVEIVVRVA